MKKNFVWIAAMLCCQVGVHAQLSAETFRPGMPVKHLSQQQITGSVKDANGQPLVGISVRNTASGETVQTDGQGTFSLKANIGDVLHISSVGYMAQDLTIDQRGQYSILLQEDTQTLSEVVVVGYGKQSRSTVTGSVASVGLDRASSRSMNNLGEVLQGKAPGVVVTNEGGDPTSKPRINIRGLGGINGEQPLYVVDGSIYSGVPMLNPNDIASISVLKDAAASIYGARASGGVILVTTKSGRKAPISIDVDAKQGFQSVWKKPQPLNAVQKAMIANQAADNAGVNRNPAYDAAKYPDGQVTRTNWVDEIIQNGYMQDYNIALDGGNEHSTLYSSFNYRKSEGILLNTYSERYNFRINAKHDIKPWLTIGENLYLNYDNGNGAATGDGYTGAIISAIYYPTNVPVYDKSGAFSGLPAEYGPGAYGDVINPVAYLKRLDIDNPMYSLVVNPYVEVKLIEGLKFRSNFSMTQGFNNFKQFTTRVPEIGKPSLSNRLTLTNTRSSDVLAEQTLTYTLDRGDHHFDALGGFNFQKINSRYNQIVGINFVSEDPALRYIVNADETLTPQDGFQQSTLVSYLARLNYNYKEKYMLSLIGRRDGSSLVAKKNRFQNYGSAALAWSLKKEDFLQDVAWLSDLKIRASYGVLGNLGSLDPFAVNPLLVRSQIFLGDAPKRVTYLAETRWANEDLTWAKSKQTNVGLDLGFMNNRLSIIADYFIKDIDNMIMELPLPGTTGLQTQIVNGGSVQDRGFELGIQYQSKNEGAFQYGIGGSLTSVKNEIKSLAGDVQTQPVNSRFRGTLNPVVLQVGESLYSYKVVETDGIFQSEEEVKAHALNGQLIQPYAQPGDFRFKDANKDGKIDADDRVFVGNAYPSFSYGLNFNASYHGFDLNLFFQGVQGNKLFNGMKFTTLNAGAGQQYNLLEGVLDAWTPENKTNDLPRVSLRDNNKNFSETSDFYVEDGSYLRLKNLTLGYTLPAGLTERMRLNKVRLYVTGNNVFTLTKYSGFDPEVGMDSFGMDSGRYPQARAFIFGLNIGF
ncbi:SusC/RagA family TonB-linked outer membrane protein [Sphingobacterium lactis]|uniref:TonB-linked outer membrane protein, SusC/RagA family n=1 Tax=Sphingobacterium lactis TaxID=797291 RepID=A0A1H5X277_9SPHI|nr:TonB-dependent receptor [Sphingobacterium lactis]SEG05912.1 TonB-linked outer membrane protein, SusC/RagA family [Sphingobacterium lactis]